MISSGTLKKGSSASALSAMKKLVNNNSVTAARAMNFKKGLISKTSQ
jgi:hypothetical protein